MAENEESEIWDVIENNAQYYDLLLDDIDMAMLMEDMDSESGSQNGLQALDVEDPAYGYPGETSDPRGST